MALTTELAARLQAREKTHQLAKALYEAELAEREDLIRYAQKEGATVREIAAAMGISFQLVGRIVGRQGATTTAGGK